MAEKLISLDNLTAYNEKLKDVLAGKVSQLTSLPEAKSDNKGAIVQYVGETTDDLIHGYFYECTESNITFRRYVGNFVPHHVNPNESTIGCHTYSVDETKGKIIKVEDYTIQDITEDSLTISDGTETITCNRYTSPDEPVVSSIAWTKVDVNGDENTKDYNALENKPLALAEDGSVEINENYVDFFGGLAGDSALTEDVTANVACGAIASGTKVDEGTNFTDFVKKLLVKYVEPTGSLSLSKTISEKWNPVAKTTLTYSATKGTNDITDIKLYVGDDLLTTITDNTSGTYEYDTEVSTTTTFKMVATDAAGHTVTKEATLSLVLPYYYGVSADATIADPSTLTALLETRGNKTKSFSPATQYIYFFYDNSYTLKSIRDSESDITDTFTKIGETTITKEGTNYTYNGYRSNDVAALTNYSLTFNFN